MRLYGHYHDDGKVTEPTHCILTRRVLNFDRRSASNTVREQVTGTKFFYRVLAHQYHRVTDDLRATWQQNAPAEGVEAVTAAPPVAGEQVSGSTEPPLPAVTNDESGSSRRKRGTTEGEG